MTTSAEPQIQQRYLELPSVRLHIAEAGEGPLVVLLHGFPDFWYTWRHLIGPLAAAGYHVVAPDMRGYHTSGKPEGIQNYRLDVLARDVADLIDAVGGGPATVLGHDWGGIVAWHTALRHPDRVGKLVVLNAPPPFGLAAHLPPPDQLLRSWYVFSFQLPALPEAMLSFNDFAMLRNALQQGTRNKHAYTKEDWDRYETAWRQPGALTAMVNYYRALAWHGPLEMASAVSRSGGFQGPVLILWGDQDPFIARQLAEPDPRRVPNTEVVHFPDAGHWVHLDRASEVTNQLITFLGS